MTHNVLMWEHLLFILQAEFNPRYEIIDEQVNPQGIKSQFILD